MVTYCFLFSKFDISFKDGAVKKVFFFLKLRHVVGIKRQMSRNKQKRQAQLIRDSVVDVRNGVLNSFFNI